jgi:hypothetical protein
MSSCGKAQLSSSHTTTLKEIIMRNLFQPVIKEHGIVRVGGFDYHMQTISYGSQRQVHVFRKHAPHKRGLVFQNAQDYEAWKNNTAQLNLPFGEQVPRPAQ